MSLRPFTREDVHRVAALRRRVFARSEQPSEEALAAHLARIFLDNPWRDEELPSWVWEDARKGIVGFVGVVPRRMVLRGRPLSVAVGTQLMVDPEHRGIAGVQLLSRLLHGPQDLTLSDSANDPARGIWERLGGSTALLYSMTWTRALRPLRYGTTQLAERGAARIAMRALRPIASAADALATRLPGSHFRLPETPGDTETLEARDMVRLLPDVIGDRALAPVYDQTSLEWLLERAAGRVVLGGMQRVLVRDGEGTDTGWFIYFRNPGGVGEVAQIAARPGREGEVLEHLLRHAAGGGLTALSGRADAALMPALGDRRASFHREGAWCLVHSREAEVLAALHRGDSFVSRLEGEWWMGF